MARTESNPFEIGKSAPDFTLPDTVSKRTLGLNQLKGDKGTVIMFICNHCPFVIHVNPELVRIAKDYDAKGVSFVAISSNDIENYPQDAPEYMEQVAHKNGYPFPYLYDESQGVAKAYDAACTPDFYLFDQQLKAVYHGQLDGSRPGNNVTNDGQSLRAAIDALLHGDAPVNEQYPSLGCNIKWKV